MTGQRSALGRVLVTGAAGFTTGHHMVMHAAKAGLDVRATDVSSRFYGALFEALGAEFVRADLTGRAGLDALLDGVDTVLHVAGIHDYSTPDAVMEAVNVRAVENVCRAAAEAGVRRFVHFSSVGVYGYGWHDARPVGEDADKLTGPPNNYNRTKWEGEQVVHRYVRGHGLRATILRPAAIYGPRSEYGLYNAFVEVKPGARMLMVGSGERREAFVHVDDVCRAALHAAGNDEMVGEAYNVSDDSVITTAEFFALVCRELTGRDKGFLRVPKRPLVALASAAQLAARALGTKPRFEAATLHYLTCDRVWSNEKLKRTGFEFEIPTVRDGLPDTLRWYKDNGWL